MYKSLYSKLGEKGQITIPAEIRNAMGLLSGHKLEFLNKGDCIIIFPVNRSISELRGMLPKPEKALSCSEMNTIIKEK